jgi:glycosyltransferase involved in cell wall biosynthesis
MSSPAPTLYPTVSVCMAVLNEGVDFETTVAMAVSSKRPPDEIVVVDDCSLEHVSPRLAPWKRLKSTRVRCLRNRRRMGSGYSKHLALASATGHVRIVVDSHMRFPYDWIDRLIEEHMKNPTSILCPVSVGFGLGTVGLGSDLVLGIQVFGSRVGVRRSANPLLSPVRWEGPTCFPSWS